MGAVERFGKYLRVITEAVEVVSMQRNTKAKGSLGVGYLHVRVMKRNQTKLQFFLH